jgi:hypothetical protein
MKNKIFSLLSLGIFALLVLTSFASATPSFSTNPTLSTNVGSHNYNITVTGATSVSPSSITITEGTSFNVVVSFNDTTNISTISYTVPAGFEFKFEKEYSFTLTANDSETSTSSSIKLTFEENTKWYNGENKGNLDVSDIELDVLEGFGEEENYWYPFDEVEIKFNVENKGSWDMEDIEIEVCVFDETKGSCVFDEDDMDISLNNFDLDEGDDEDIKITFQVDADNLKAGNTEYTIYIKAVGQIDDKESDYDGDNSGDSDLFEDLEIYTDDDFVIINNIQFNQESASCGDTITLTAEVWNVGDSDLDDDEIFVRAFNKALGIDKVFEFGSGIDAMESEEITLSFELSDVDEGNYLIQFTAYNDEDMDDDEIFETRHEEDEAIFYKELKVEGSCSGSSTTPTASVSAKLDSEAKAGKDLIVKATIVNTGSETKTFTLSASGYASWASSATLDKTSVTIFAGQSAEVAITLAVSKDAEGENGFDVEVLDGTKFLSQPVKVTVEKASLFPSLTGLTAGFSDNAYLYGIGALNILLVAVIIFVAVRVARRKQE